MPREKINKQQVEISELGKNSEKKVKNDRMSRKQFEDFYKDLSEREYTGIENEEDIDDDFFDKEFQFVGDEEKLKTQKPSDMEQINIVSSKESSTKHNGSHEKININNSNDSDKKRSDTIKNKSESERPKKKKTSPWLILGIFTLILLAGAGIWYGSGAHYYSTHFLRGTIINGMDVSGMTYDELANNLRGYSIVVKQRGKKDNSQYVEKITGNEIGVEIVSESGIKEIMENQSLWKWYAPSGKIYEKDVLIGFDEKLFEKRIDSLKGFREGQYEKPKSATISDYDSQKGYTVVAEKQGNQLKKKVVIEVVKNAVLHLEKEIDLDKNGCYKKPKVDSGDKKLNDKVNKLNKYVNVKITYTFGTNKEEVNGKLIKDWLVIDDENNKISLDKEKVGEYVATLRKKYDTIFRPRDFKTKSGKTVRLEDGDYGWWMNYVEETRQLAEQIEKGKSGKRTPVYYQTAAQYGPKDYGNTYVEVNLTAQKLYVFVNGKVKVKSDVCTGNTSLKRGTNPGVYGITYKERYGVLVGETYESTVAYWMPFNDDIGLHDAIWKTQFGSNFYKKEGSHGCVNLPYNTAKKIYGLVEKNTPVIVYELPGTESDSVTVQSYEEIANAAIEAIDAIGTINKDSGDRIKTARYMYNKVGSAGQKYVTNYDVLVRAEKDFKALN
ncbi:MAG: L,D-transpeptidase/peptidoglycan binding protein [Lachnospiraceae bacterium]|nr:L,D-transpeptidase/peptidoglycan binding protein [Lachnospiraceae bacterium]